MRRTNARCGSKHNRHVTAYVLRKVARNMTPFFRLIADNQRYAQCWSKAVVHANATALRRLFRIASPQAKRPLPSTDGRGYLINFEFKGPVPLYGSGTENTSVNGKFIFETRVHRAISRAILPLYVTLAVNPAFARALALAIRLGDVRAVTCIVKSVVTAPQLQSVSIEESGIALAFKYAFSKYRYEHFLLSERFE
jgi:hypothetical protein